MYLGLICVNTSFLSVCDMMATMTERLDWIKKAYLSVWLLYSDSSGRMLLQGRSALWGLYLILL